MCVYFILSKRWDSRIVEVIHGSREGESYLKRDTIIDLVNLAGKYLLSKTMLISYYEVLEFNRIVKFYILSWIIIGSCI